MDKTAGHEERSTNTTHLPTRSLTSFSAFLSLKKDFNASGGQFDQRFVKNIVHFIFFVPSNPLM